MHRKIFSFFVTAILLVHITGCGTAESASVSDKGDTGEPKQTVQQTKAIEETQVKQQPGNETNNNNKQDSGANTEYGVPNRTEPEAYPEGQIHLLTEDDIQQAVSQLVKKGYLNKTNVNAASFKTALSQYQEEQGLTPSGQLDPETFAKLTR